MKYSESQINKICKDLQSKIQGKVLSDPFSRGRYSTDSSLYQITPLGAVLPKDQNDVLKRVLCLKDIAEISTGSACTSASYTPSHVLTSMGLSENDATKVVRFSWGPNTNKDIWKKMMVIN